MPNFGCSRLRFFLNDLTAEGAEGAESPEEREMNNSDTNGFDMNPVSLEKNRGFKEHELNQIARLVEEYEKILLEAWDDYFDT